MVRVVLIVTSLVSACAPAFAAQRQHRDARHARGAHHHRVAHHQETVGIERQPYASRVSPTPTCRYADGTPFDPDIIGGPNHVGDGGPAANLGGFDPCGF